MQHIYTYRTCSPVSLVVFIMETTSASLCIGAKAMRNSCLTFSIQNVEYTNRTKIVFSFVLFTREVSNFLFN